eukprot:126117-Rhodomonas_salina.2
MAGLLYPGLNTLRTRLHRDRRSLRVRMSPPAAVCKSLLFFGGSGSVRNSWIAGSPFSTTCAGGISIAFPSTHKPGQSQRRVSTCNIGHKVSAFRVWG